MGMNAYALAMAVMIAAGGGAPQAAMLERPEVGLLAAGDEALAGIDRLCCVVGAGETPEAMRLVNTELLQARIANRLAQSGIALVECRRGLTPRLVVQIEVTQVPDCGRHVCRVQTSVNRVVTFSNRRDLHVVAAVWQLRPTIEVVPDEEVAWAIDAAATVQIDAFIVTWQAARSLQPRGGPSAGTPTSDDAAQHDIQDTAGNAQTQYRFVASRNSSVFHRPDCRWAGNIAEKNLVGFRTRQEALRAGKRPCKSCKP